MELLVRALSPHPPCVAILDRAVEALSPFFTTSSSTPGQGITQEGNFFWRGRAIKFGAEREIPMGRAMARAMGPGVSRICDLTCGQGRDALSFLIAGHKVVAYERNPTVGALFLAHLSNRARALEGTFEYVLGDFLNDPQGPGPCDVFYYDPMELSPKRKSLPPGGVQLVGQLVGQDDQDQQFVAKRVLEKMQAPRLVIKRRRKSPLMAGLGAPNFQVSSKLIRFDVYKKARGKF